MQDLETKIPNELDFQVPIYYRYVDDTFLIIPENKIQHIISGFHSYHPRLQFAHEIEITVS